MPLSAANANPIPTKAGVGLRFQHHEVVLESRPSVAWFEVHTENYMGGGKPARYLEAIRKDYPISLHGVGLSLGSADGLDADHLEKVRKTVDWIQPGLVSEHMSWSAVGGMHIVDLLPLPMTEEALDVICRNIDEVQTYLKRQILVENPSTYLEFTHSTIPEWEFIAAVARRTGCGILCDVNNIYVSARNHGWSPSQYVAALPPNAVGEIHLAGHTLKTLDDGRSLRIDDHGSRVGIEVWRLYAEALRRFGRIPTLIEWDTNVPPLDVLLSEATQAEVIAVGISGDRAHADVA